MLMYHMVPWRHDIMQYSVTVVADCSSSGGTSAAEALPSAGTREETLRSSVWGRATRLNTHFFPQIR